MRMMRRAGLISVNKELTLEKLFASATILTSYGTNQSKASFADNGVSQSYAPASGICYLFITCNGCIGIYKVVDRAIPAHDALRITATSSDGYCGVNVTGGRFNYIGWRGTSTPYYAQGSSPAATQGNTLALIQFSGIDDTLIDTLFTTMSINSMSSALGSSPTTVSTTNKVCNLYLATKASNLDFWTPTSSNYTKINNASTSSAAATASSGTLSIGSVYGGSIIGFTNP